MHTERGNPYQSDRVPKAEPVRSWWVGVQSLIYRTRVSLEKIQSGIEIYSIEVNKEKQGELKQRKHHV